MDVKNLIVSGLLGIFIVLYFRSRSRIKFLEFENKALRSAVAQMQLQLMAPIFLDIAKKYLPDFGSLFSNSDVLDKDVLGD
jgi:hypothetical protein